MPFTLQGISELCLLFAVFAMHVPLFLQGKDHMIPCSLRHSAAQTSADKTQKLYLYQNRCHAEEVTFFLLCFALMLCVDLFRFDLLCFLLQAIQPAMLFVTSTTELRRGFDLLSVRSAVFFCYGPLYPLKNYL